MNKRIKKKKAKPENNIDFIVEKMKEHCLYIHEKIVINCFEMSRPFLKKGN